MGTAKNLAGLCCAVLTASISLCVAHRIIGTGLGTLLAAFGTGRVIALFNHLFVVWLWSLVPEQNFH